MGDLCEVLRGGGLVACPTETSTALVGDPLQPGVLDRLFALKGRSSGAPVALLCPDLRCAETLWVKPLSKVVRGQVAPHWPGPLTAVCMARPGVDARLLLDGKLGFRIPGSSPALQLVVAYGGALTATSANRSGEPSMDAWRDVAKAFSSSLDGVVTRDAPGGEASTVVDLSDEVPRVIRQGPVVLE